MMEAGGISLREWVNQRFENSDARIRGVHDSVKDIRKDVAKHDRFNGQVETRLEEIGKDIKELKDDMKWIKRGLFGGIAVGISFTLALAALIVQAAT